MPSSPQAAPQKIETPSSKLPVWLSAGVSYRTHRVNDAMMKPEARQEGSKFASHTLPDSCKTASEERLAQHCSPTDTLHPCEVQPPAAALS
eukprot:761689-Hanusia_phi.AAC.4